MWDLPGTSLSGTGRLDRSREDRCVLWLSDVWQVERFRWSAYSPIEVTLSGSFECEHAALVNVIGSWVEGRLEEATVTGVNSFEPTYLHSKSELSPGRAGIEEAMATFAAVEELGVPVLASGGTDEFLWCQVLYAHPQMATLLEDSPVSLRIYPALTPVLG